MRLALPILCGLLLAGLCIITQFADTPTYVRTIHHMSMYPPNMLLVPASGFSSWKSNFSGSDSRANKRPRVRQDETDSNQDTAPNNEQRAGTSILIRCLEELLEIKASPFHRKHWNYQEGKNPSSREHFGESFLLTLRLVNYRDCRRSLP